MDWDISEFRCPSIPASVPDSLHSGFAHFALIACVALESYREIRTRVSFHRKPVSVGKSTSASTSECRAGKAAGAPYDWFTRCLCGAAARPVSANSASGKTSRVVRQFDIQADGFASTCGMLLSAFPSQLRFGPGALERMSGSVYRHSALFASRSSRSASMSCQMVRTYFDFPTLAPASSLERKIPQVAPSAPIG